MAHSIPFKVPFTGLVEAAYHLLVNHATYTHEWLQRLHRSGKDRSDLTNSVVALGVICSTEFSQGGAWISQHS